jgi:hypothetical protein
MKTAMNQALIDDLRELIAALDRRVPRLERAGESDIVHDAEALKHAALRRIAELGGMRPAGATVVAAVERV